jgi:hypothetical protein
MKTKFLACAHAIAVAWRRRSGPRCFAIETVPNIAELTSQGLAPLISRHIKDSSGRQPLAF